MPISPPTLPGSRPAKAYMVVGVVLPQVDLSIILPAAGEVGEEEMSRLTEVAAA